MIQCDRPRSKTKEIYEPQSMGGLLHLFDLNLSAAPAGKSFSQRREDEANLEAPRNSLELQLEASHTYFDLKDVLCSQEDTEEVWFQRSIYPIEESMKKLINDEISRRPNSKHGAPSLVAKLMGVDALPTVAAANASGYFQEKALPQKLSLFGKERSTRGSANQSARSCYESSQMESGSTDCRRYDRNGKRWDPWQQPDMPMRREHPQEEELQKFKKEFEAWQASRFKQCPKTAAPETVQLLSQKSFDKENASVYANVKGVSNDLIHYTCRSEEPIEDLRYRSKPQFSSIEYDKQSSAPTKIVILRPGAPRISDHEETATTSSGTIEDRGSIEDFLEEVKERLKFELQGRARKRSSTVRGSGIETPFSEKPPDARKLVGGRYTGDDRGPGMSLLRSESTKSHRSEAEMGLGLMSRDTRNFLSRRLRNVMKGDKNTDVPVNFSGLSRLSMCETDGELKEAEARDHSFGDEDMKARWSRSCDKDDDSSPRNLRRSLSAPVSGTSFGKLLLEDRQVVGGGQIRRKHEAIESLSEDAGIRKDRFNLRKKVSSIRSSLRGRLFGKKMQSMLEAEDNCFEHGFMNDGSSFWSLCERNDNSTEVPPSPASMCPSTPEEAWRGMDCTSPVSTNTMEDDSMVSQAFREISSNLSDLRRQLNELDSTVLPREEARAKEEDQGSVRDVLEERLKLRLRMKGEREGERGLVFDLLNEALEKVVGGVGSAMKGKRLVERVWERLRECLNPEGEAWESEYWVARDLERGAWSSLIDEETSGVGRDVGCMLMVDLLEEIVNEMEMEMECPRL